MKYLLLILIVAVAACSKGKDLPKDGLICWECEIKCGGVRDTLIWNNGDVPPPSYNDGWGNVCGLQNCKRK